MKNCVVADAASTFAASLPRAAMFSSFRTLASIFAALFCRLVMLRSTWISVWLTERQNGRKPFNMWCRSW